MFSHTHRLAAEPQICYNCWWSHCNSNLLEWMFFLPKYGWSKKSVKLESSRKIISLQYTSYHLFYFCIHFFVLLYLEPIVIHFGGQIVEIIEHHSWWPKNICNLYWIYTGVSSSHCLRSLLAIDCTGFLGGWNAWLYMRNV